MRCLQLTMLNFALIQGMEADKAKLLSLVERAIELWNKEMATDDHAVALSVLSIRLAMVKDMDKVA